MQNTDYPGKDSEFPGIGKHPFSRQRNTFRILPSAIEVLKRAARNNNVLRIEYAQFSLCLIVSDTKERKGLETVLLESSLPSLLVNFRRGN